MDEKVKFCVDRGTEGGRKRGDKALCVFMDYG